MDVSRWWKAFLTTFDQNQDQKCDKSLTLKASCIRTDGQWKILLQHSEVNEEKHMVQMSRHVVQKLLGSESWQRSSSRIACCSTVFGSYKYESSPIFPNQWTLPWFFPIPEDETETQGVTFWQQWRDPDQTAEHDVDTDVKWLTEVLPIMEILLESRYQCQRGILQRGWGRTEISVGG